ncbi:MAG TPA: PAS domain-containing protein, partial [Clostridia bacterium]|nr:PAS domain-containing protein [Clostridia bacterium]
MLTTNGTLAKGPQTHPGGEPPLSAEIAHVGWLEGGLAIVDSAGKIQEANAALAGWLGLPVSELVGRPLGALLLERCSAWQDGWDR